MIILLMLTGASRATVPPLLAARPFAVGERLEYRIRLGPVTVGSATLEIRALQASGDRAAYEVRYTARSNRVLAPLYPVRDRITSWADTLDFRSHRLQKRIREGPYHEVRDLRLDHEASEATALDGTVLAIPSRCHDVFSALLRMRASQLAPGSHLEMPVILGGAVASLAVAVAPSEHRVAVPAGAFRCIAVMPNLEGRGPFRHDGPVIVDLGCDGIRPPVRISVRVPIVGRLRAELVEIATVSVGHR